jgi:citrate lyase beta subunit
MGNVNRSFLFVPADKPERASKATRLPTDAVIIELEDGVSLENKVVAREQAEQILAEIDFGQQTIALRPNRITTLHGIADIQAMSTWRRKPDLLILPKVESDGEVMIYDALLTEMGVDCELMILIESSRGLLNAASIVTASTRTTCLSFGLADLAAELGCKPTWEVLSTYRSSLVVSCGLAGIVPIDTAFLDLNNPNKLAVECQKVHDMGYAGKLCIHPSQLDIVNTAFTPTQAEIDWARKIVNESEKLGLGVIVVDGRMIDKPVIETARRTVAMAAHFGL